jgi:hypothetical protein
LSDVSERVSFVLDPSNDQLLRAMAGNSSQLIKSLSYASETSQTRNLLSKCFLKGLCSPASIHRAAKAAAAAAEEKGEKEEGGLGEPEELSPELVASFNAALVRGLGVLLKRNPDLWQAVEKATACSLFPP